MAQEIADRRDIDFVLWEQMDCEDILKYKEYAEFNKKTCDMTLTEARKLTIKEVLPTMAESDEQGIRYEKGEVKVPDCLHRAHKLILEGEWGSLGVATEMGGQGAPAFLHASVAEYFMGANWPLYAYVEMGNGTAEMIHKFGTKEQIDTYIPNLIAGKWGGTMLLTESEAGSDVGALTTSAVRNSDGTYSLTGNKIFITNGEHDLCENIIHPVLARIEGDPEGTKGISIFIVPKYFVNEDGSLGDRNDIICTGAEEKHGIHASATCSMAMGSKGKCIGYLLGEECRGIKIMFNMMNGARMATGLQGLAYASSSYLLALNYAKERVQGKDLLSFGDATAPSVTIINHPDVRRNLLWMKSLVDGMRSFFYFMTVLGTKGEIAEDEIEREKSTALFDLLTPLIKCYLSDRGYEVCVQGMQIFGGAGYTRDYLAEQYARDCKIASIFEGTSGIQAMDLLGRKLGMNNGKTFMSFLGKIHKTVAQAKEVESLKMLAGDVEKLANRLGEVAMHMGKTAMSPDVKVAFAHSLPFLYVIGDTIMAWMLLWRAVVAAPKLAAGPKKKEAAFYEGQFKTAEFFINTVVPKTNGEMDAILKTSPAAMEISDDSFGGL